MEPNRPRPASSSSTPSAVAVAPSPHPEWGDHEARVRTRLEFGWVVATWALCMLAALAIAAVSTLIVGALSETSLTSETNTELGVLTIIAAMSTFIGFVVVLVMRLTKVAHDRLVNSLAVPLLHIAVAAVLFATELALQAAGIGVADLLAGPWTDQVGNAFTVLERSAVAAVLAGLLAAGMVPARGDRPRGTQTAPTPQDLQL